jgi:enoyl-CoA hydratase/carnithine racemase
VSLVEYSAEDAVAVITLARPPVNALNGELISDLDGAVARAMDPSVRAVVLTGSPHFAAGADITEFTAAYESGDVRLVARRLTDVIRRLEQLPKPVIAAIRGYALGGGLEVALGCDFRYLAEDAKVGLPEIKLGIIPGAGGTQRLPRLIGLGPAREMIYSGRFVDATEARDLGLADRVLKPEALLDEAVDYASAWAKGPTVALGSAKKSVNDGWGRPIDEGLTVEVEAFAECFSSEDAREGTAAFLDKRDPSFTGR